MGAVPRGDQVSKLRFTEIDCKQLGRSKSKSKSKPSLDTVKPALFLSAAISVVAAGGYLGYEPTERWLQQAVTSLSTPTSDRAPGTAGFWQDPSGTPQTSVEWARSDAASSISDAASRQQGAMSDRIVSNLPPLDDVSIVRSAPAIGELPVQPTGVYARLVAEHEHRPSLFARIRDRFQSDDAGADESAPTIAGTRAGDSRQQPSEMGVWAGTELWMEPFMPFRVAGSIDQIVAGMAARMPDPFEGYQRVVVQSGDSLARILTRMGISSSTQHAMLHSGADMRVLSRLHPGDEIYLRFDQSDRLVGLRFPINNSRTLIIQHSETSGGYISRFEDQPYETRRLYTSGSIDRSLYLSARRAGLSHRQIMEFMSIFEWQVDFTRDARRGDTFAVVYEAEFVNGEKVSDGRIVAASFVNAGRRLEAVYYETPGGGNRGYFDGEGRNMMKAFIRQPVQNAWISSQFDRNRLHPILGVRRPHLGTDFAAPTGTPVMAAGNGRVLSAGRNGGYGNAIVIEHGGQIRTLYAHLSRFESGITAGTTVEQGQVIGYVGATGLATGPHLHYEFKVNGQHQDPMRVDLPTGEPVPEQHLAHFRSSTASLLAGLQRAGETQLAMNQNN